MASTISTPVQSLSALALKVKQNVFDVSSWLRHVSIRDQVIRARLLVRDLVEANQLSDGDEVLIIGAGAAGLSLARACSLNGVRTTVIDKNNDILSLWKGVTERYVGPYMYEWPTSFHGDQQFPPQSPSSLSHWVKPGSSLDPDALTFPQHPEQADRLRTSWRKLAQKWSSGPLQILVSADATNNPSLNKAIKDWCQDVKSSKGKPSFVISIVASPWHESILNKLQSFRVMPKFIFLAAGFGDEDNKLVDQAKAHCHTGIQFWADDNLKKHHAGFTRSPKIAIFGGGDGALQDTLRALVKGKHALETLGLIETSTKARDALLAVYGKLESSARQHESSVAWGVSLKSAAKDDFYLAIDKACKAAADEVLGKPDVCAALRSCIRTDIREVHLIVRENYFGKAYLLNRFLVLLFERYFERCDFDQPYASYARLHIHRKHELKAFKKSVTHYGVAYSLHLMSGMTLTVDEVVVRFGIDPTTVPGQLLGLTKKDSKNRRELAEIQLPYWEG